MRRAWVLITALALASCGSLSSAPTPLTGDLLSAPTTLNVNGTLVRADAAPRVSGEQFKVQVRVQTTRPPLPTLSVPTLSVTGVYVITNSGVWKSTVPTSARLNCGARFCVQGTATGRAEGLRAGEGVQVIVRLRDVQGRVLWLRDAQAKVAGTR